MRDKPPRPPFGSLVVDLLPEASRPASKSQSTTRKPRQPDKVKTPPLPPRVLPVKPALVPPRPLDMIELTRRIAARTLAAAQGRRWQQRRSESVGAGPRRNSLTRRTWAREPPTPSSPAICRQMLPRLGTDRLRTPGNASTMRRAWQFAARIASRKRRPAGGVAVSCAATTQGWAANGRRMGPDPHRLPPQPKRLIRHCPLLATRQTLADFSMA